MNHRRNSGFTITELIIVIVIIGILSAVVIVSYNGIVKSARDASVLSDIEKMDELQAYYGTTHRVAGRAYYSGSGTDPDINFTTSSGVIIDVVTNGVDYCIRAYDPSSNINSILNAEERGTSNNACEILGPSSAALSVLPPGTLPDVNVSLSGSNVVAIIDEVTCQGGTTQYQVRSREDGGNWSDYSSWNTERIFSEAIVSGIKYEYQAQSRCYTSEAVQSTPVLGSVGEYQYDDDHMPIATSISGYWSSAPAGYLLEDGSAVSRTTYADLFAVIGTTYGSGDGSTTFNLPDSRGRIAVNKNTSDAEFASLGQKYGEKTHLLTSSESGVSVHSHTASSGADSPNHTHTYWGETTSGGTSTWYSHFDNQSYHFFNHYESQNSSGASVRHTHSITVNNSSSSSASSSHNEIQPTIVKLNAIKAISIVDTTSKLPASASIEGYFSSAPAGYLLEDGSAVSRTTYADLFAVIGTTYGSGDGSTTFNLPDSRGRTKVNKNSSDTEFDILGEKYGSKTVTLTANESATTAHGHTASSGVDSQNHTHTYTGETTSGGGPTWYSHRDGQYSHNFYTYGTPTGGVSASHYHTITVNNHAGASSSSSHNNIQPSIVKIFAVKYTPSQSISDYVAKGTSISGYFSSAPVGYLLEDGSAVSRTTYADLFAVVGTTYGSGDGSTTFNLPDSRGKVIANQNTSDSDFDVIGEAAGTGQKSHTLTAAETGAVAHNHTASSGNDSPDHTHTFQRESESGGPPWYSHSNTQSSHYFYTYTTLTSSGVSTSHTHSITINNNTGANAASAHNNVQPSIVQNFAIKY